MTQLVGLLTNSTGTPLDGIFTAQLTENNSTDQTDPDTLYTKVLQEFPITSGVLDVEIPASDEYQIAYRFTFTPDAATDTLFDILAIMPATGPVNLPTLMSTGITNRNLDTGALRVAKVLGTNPDLSLLIKQPAVHTVDANDLDPAGGDKTWYLPKPFAGAIAVNTAAILGISGYEDWEFEIGLVNSSGNDSAFTSETTATNTSNGRRHILRTYDVSRAASVMGLYIKALPQAGAGNLNATLSISYTEITA